MAAIAAWSQRKCGQIPGTRQLGREHLPGSPAQRAPHMLAVGPPTSLIDPFQAGCRVMAAASPAMERELRDLTRRPWCSASEQNEQPPAQPRCEVMLNRIISSAGTGLRYDGCAARENGSA
jgi:hypothetical protein